MFILRFLVGILSIGTMVTGTGMVSSQDYPSKPIRIVTSTAGGGGDFTARQVAQGISGLLGQPVIVDNRTGPTSSGVVAKAPPDGYTLLVNGAVFWISPLMQKTSYDPVSDFEPISVIERGVFIIAVHPSVPVKSVKELIALAKAKPGALHYASTGVSTSNHLAAELFKTMGGVNIVHVPYKGATQRITALISGEVQMVMADTGLLVPLAKAGKLRALAVTTAQPSVLAPGLPTVAASGLPDYEAVNLNGLWAPAKTPEPIIRRLNQETVRFLNQPDVKERFLDAGLETVGNSPREFAAIIKSDMVRMSKVIKDAGIKLD